VGWLPTTGLGAVSGPGLDPFFLTDTGGFSLTGGAGAAAAALGAAGGGAGLGLMVLPQLQ
jgi:hypothetical protein